MEISELQDRVYELEGLIELYQQREYKRDILLPLIKGKISLISAFIETDSEKEETVVEKAGEIFADDDVEPEEPVYNPVLKIVKTEQEVAVPQPRTIVPKREKPKFCINDRFLFIRELFGGSAAEFDSAMEKVSMMGDFEEAEDYLIGERGLDPENENVVDLLEIMQQYFGTNN